MFERPGRRARSLQDESRVSSRLRDGLNHYAVSMPTGRVRGFGAPAQESRIIDREVIRLAEEAFDARRRALVESSRRVVLDPALPVLYLGDRDAYSSSRRRIVTVGLNPSKAEFPDDDPFTRFPLTAESAEPGMAYLAALDTYFKTNPHDSWFSSFESVVNGLDASYYPGADNTVLHTNLCTPVATDPAWSRIGSAPQTALMGQGVPLWHRLVEVLRPDIVLISVGRAYLEKVDFELGEPFEISRLEDGDRRPYVTEGRWMEMAGHRALLVFGQASNRPFGLVADMHKAGIGGRIADAVATQTSGSGTRIWHQAPRE